MPSHFQPDKNSENTDNTLTREDELRRNSVNRISQKKALVEIFGIINMNKIE